MVEPGRVKKSDLKAIIAKGEDSRLQFMAGMEILDKLRFRDFLKKVYHLDIPDKPEDLRTLPQNINLALVSFQKVQSNASRFPLPYEKELAAEIERTRALLEDRKRRPHSAKDRL